jgi:hypothetical protein
MFLSESFSFESDSIVWLDGWGMVLVTKKAAA